MLLLTEGCWSVSTVLEIKDKPVSRPGQRANIEEMSPKI